MMSEGVNKGKISLERFVESCCTAPAKVFGLYPKKGVIQVGSDADIVVIDPKKKLKIKADNLLHVCDWTPFEGWEVEGIPVLTLVKGKIMMKDGEVYGEPGWGNFVPRKTPNTHKPQRIQNV
jgi:dihydroorotase-like cyclic amidohydrolase